MPLYNLYTWELNNKMLLGTHQGTHWDFDGNILGTNIIPKKKPPFPTPQIQKEKTKSF